VARAALLIGDQQQEVGRPVAQSRVSFPGIRRRRRRQTKVTRYDVLSGPVIDPLNRWAELGEKPDYAGLLTFAGGSYTEDVAELEGVDVAIVGAPMDDLVSDRPGARLAPRAIRAASSPPGPHLEAGVDATEELRVVDFGDAAVRPADPRASHAAIEELVGQVLGAGAIPVTLGGDHSITEPCVRACAAAHGPLGVIHFDTHTDTGEHVFGVEYSHGTFMRTLIDDGHVDPARYAQIGLRGYWPGESDFAWQRERQITSLFAHDVRDLGIREVVERAIAAVGEGPVYLTVDIDVLDPAFVPGTGTPEPGGLSTSELLLGAREVAAAADIVGADLVEVIPTAIGTADSSALAGERTVREILTGIALRRRAARDSS
jgi:agmatinase